MPGGNFQSPSDICFSSVFSEPFLSAPRKIHFRGKTADKRVHESSWNSLLPYHFRNDPEILRVTAASFPDQKESNEMNCPGAEHAPVPGISPPGDPLARPDRGRTRWKARSYFHDAEHCTVSLFFSSGQNLRPGRRPALTRPDKGMMPVWPSGDVEPGSPVTLPSSDNGSSSPGAPAPMQTPPSASCDQKNLRPNCIELIFPSSPLHEPPQDHR